MTLRNLNIAPRASLGFGLLALLVLLLGSFSLLQMAEINKKSEEINGNWLPSILSLGEINQDILRIRALTLRSMLIHDDGMTQQNLASINELVGKLNVAQDSYERRSLQASPRRLLPRAA